MLEEIPPNARNPHVKKAKDRTSALPDAADAPPAGGAPAARANGASSGKWRWPWAASVIALVAMLGLILGMYPTVAAWYTQLDQSRVIRNSVAMMDANPQANAKELSLARQYNDALISGAVLDSGARIPTGNGTTETTLQYNKLLVDELTGVMARLRIPKIDLDLPVYHGTSDETLLKGLGHLEGTSLPVGGLGTHAVITGHRGLANATMFTNLNEVGDGDTFSIETEGEVFSYRVIRTQVVDPDQTQSLEAVPGKDLVTLVTCTPIGINSQRILVTAERVLPTYAADIAAAHEVPTIPGFPWWAVILGGGFVALSIYVWRAGYPPKPRGKSKGRGKHRPAKGKAAGNVTGEAASNAAN